MTGAGISETSQLIEPWLYHTLINIPSLVTLLGSADLIGGSLNAMATDDLYVTFSLLDSADRRGVGMRGRILNDCTYLVKTVSEGLTQDKASRAFTLYDAALDGVDVDYTVAADPAANRPLAVAGHITCWRERIISYDEVERNRTVSGGQAFLHLGANYRILASDVHTL